jgi:hypothetical protein
MVNNSTNIRKTNTYLSHLLTEYIKRVHDTRQYWKYRSQDMYNNVEESSRLMGFIPNILSWFPDGNTCIIIRQNKPAHIDMFIETDIKGQLLSIIIMNLTTLLCFVCESLHLFIADILTWHIVIVVVGKLHNVFSKSISIVEIAMFIHWFLDRNIMLSLNLFSEWHHHHQFVYS